MLDRQIKLGNTSNIIRVKLRKADTGQGLTGLAYNTSGLIISTICDNESSATVYTAAGSTIEDITTLGTFAAPTATKCRFKKVDDTNHPGTCEIQIADARFAVSNARVLRISILGATNLLERELVIELVGYDPIDSVRAGLTALPNAAAEAAGGLYTRGTGAGQINQPANGRVDANAVAINSVATTSVTTVSAYIGTTAANTAQTGDSYPIVSHTDYGNAKLVRSTTPANTLTVSAGNKASSDMTAIMGTLLAENVTGYLAASFRKFFDIGSPTGTINSLPGAIPGANNGLPTTNGTKINQTVDLTAGQTIKADLDTIKTQAVTCAAPVTVNVNVGHTQPINFTGTSTSALVKADVIDVGGTVQTPGDIIPAISGIGTAGGAAINQDAATDNVGGGISGVTSGTTLVGSQTSGTYSSTSVLDGTYHVITGTSTAIDIVYQFLTGGGTTPINLVWTGYVVSSNDTVTIAAWNHVGGAWETVGSITGQNGTTNTVKNIILYSRHAGTSAAELGKVYLRFYATGMTNPELHTDQVYVSYSITSRTVGYSEGAIWLDTVNGSAGTVSYVNGTADHPVSTLANALTLASNIGLRRIRVINGSSLTLASGLTNYTLTGKNWTLALGGQAISGSHFEGAVVSGIASGTTRCEFEECSISAATIPPAILRHCGIGNAAGTFTLASAGQYDFVDCYSEVAGSGTPVFAMNGIGSATQVQFRRWSGGTNITADSNITMSVESVSAGTQTIVTGGCNAEYRGCFKGFTITTSGTGTLNLRGLLGVVAISGSGGTVTLGGVTDSVTDTSSGTTITDRSNGASHGFTLANGQIVIKKNVARANFAFPMFDSTGALKTGLTVTASIRKDSGSFATMAGSVTEIGTTGWYTVDFAQAETNADTIAFNASASGANPTCFTILTQA